MNIVPEKELLHLLKKVENPGRYVGGEYGIIRKENPRLRIALCFPDIYEIGMSNQAIYILYSLINQIEDVSCERVFSPAEDFEGELKNASIPLYSLETGTPLHEFDIVAFSVGFELLATNILAVLNLGGIPLNSADRKMSDPIIIAGGPAITNPLPLSNFIDAFFIGEAEQRFPQILLNLLHIKKRNGNRQDMLECLSIFSCIWMREKRVTMREAFSGFHNSSFISPLVPSLRTVQDHGVVEIMRGCPNGCRFCHAGILYRPYRMRNPDIIHQHVSHLVHNLGYREISLSSLSSADYLGIEKLIRELNNKYSNSYISFSLPSLHVESFGLHILSQLAEVRKSGLTFAVETPLFIFQNSLNKIASKDKIISIINEAKTKGWKIIKFYFMIGLPFSQDFDEINEIKNFIEEVYYSTKLPLNINIGTFIPKPHTPFQWSFQLNENEASEKLSYLKKTISNKNIKLSYHSPFLSYLEGILSRGDERVGDFIISAFYKGARFDSWDEKIKKNCWRDTLIQATWNIEEEIFKPRSLSSSLPWDSINLGVSKDYLLSEVKKSEKRDFTEPCSLKCSHHCGVCNSQIKPVINNQHIPFLTNENTQKTKRPQEIHRFLFSYSKMSKAIYIPHLSLMTVFERSFIRGNFNLRYSNGFNPKPFLEFAQPLSLGLVSFDEIAIIDCFDSITENLFITNLNKFLPEGIIIKEVKIFKYLEGEKKLPSLMSSYGASSFKINVDDDKDLFQILLEKIRHMSNISLKEINYANQFVELLFSSTSNNPGFISLFKNVFSSNHFNQFNITKLSSLAVNKKGEIGSFFLDHIYPGN